MRRRDLDSKIERTRTAIREQEEWIERCEANGVSYAETEEKAMRGTSGAAIRAADEAHLARLRDDLAYFEAERAKKGDRR